VTETEIVVSATEHLKIPRRSRIPKHSQTSARARRKQSLKGLLNPIHPAPVLMSLV
jgi:hypothetical protein